MEKEISITCVESGDAYQERPKQSPPVVDPVVKTWPTDPKPLVPSATDRALMTAYDMVLILLPILLMTKTGLCIYAHRYDQYNIGTSVDSVSLLSLGLVKFNDQLVTLFTIVFVTIVSTFVKRFALWKAQRGAYVRDLEQLQGSISLPSTLKLIWSLRSFSLRSILLVLAWSFYYLGSQAVKREYQLSMSDPYADMKVVTTKVDAPSCLAPNLDSILENSARYSLSTMLKTPASLIKELNIYFGSILLEPPPAEGAGSTQYGTKNGPLVPDYYKALQEMPRGSLIDKVYYKAGGWVGTSHRSQMYYVTNTGLPVWPDQPSKAGNITVRYAHKGLSMLGTYILHNTSYFNVSCGPLMMNSVFMFPNGTDNSTLVSLNMTTVRDDTTKDRNGFPLREFGYSALVWAADPIPQALIDAMSPEGLYPSANYSRRVIKTTCSVSARYIDMQVSCLETGCYPARIRWSDDTSEANATGYSTPFDNDAFASTFFNNLIQSMGKENDPEVFTVVDNSVMMLQYMNTTFSSTLGPAMPISPNPDDPLGRGASASLSTKLWQGMNTYYTLSQYAITKGLAPNSQSVIDQVGEDPFFESLDAIGSIYLPAYRIYWQWIAIDFASCCILLAAATGAYWLRVTTLAPDIFGFVSSLTRDNPHISLPTEGSALNGIERARMLKKVKVRIGNVQEVGAEGGTAGTVGLAPVQAGVQPLRPTHLYR